MSVRGLEVPAIVLIAAALAALQGWAVVVSTPTHPGSIGLNLDALGTDWMVFHGGVRWLLEGHLGALFDGERFTAYLNSAFAGWLSQPMPYRPWVYPPTYLFVVLPFGMLPFAASYVAFQLASAALLAGALWLHAARPILEPNPTPNSRSLVIAAALLGPAAAINVGLGQNSFLVAALLVGGLRIVPARPALGGVILGLLTVKPQDWLLMPLALAAARQWKALAWSMIAALALALASLAAFGFDAWHHWLRVAQVGYEGPQLGGVWDDSIYASLAAAGASHGLANAAQVAGTLLGAGLVYYAFRLRLSDNRKLAVLLAATVFAAPHSSLSDTVLLALAAVLWIGDQLAADASLAKWTLALALWLTPLYNPPLISLLGQLTPLLILGFIAVAIGTAQPGATQPGSTVPPTAPHPLAAEE